MHTENATHKVKTHKMTTGRPLTTILLFAIPMILSNLFQQMYNVIDTLIVGQQLGKDALAAVGSAGSIIAVFVQLSIGLALGGSIIVSQYFGAGRTEKIRNCVTTLVIFLGGLAFLSMIFVWIFAKPLLIMVNTPEEIVEMGVSYLRMYFLGCIPVFIYTALNSIYAALGNSRTPLVFLIISSILNVGLDLFFIIVLKMGVGGAALATAISQALACILAVFDTPKLLSDFERDKSQPVFDFGQLKVILRFGIPSALQQSIISVGSVVVQATINSFGAAVMAGSAAASKVINLATTIPLNYSNAYTNYVGQNIGAGKEERIWPGLRSSIICCGFISVIITFIFEVFPEQIISMFIDETETDIVQVITVGSDYIRVIGAFMIVFSTFVIAKATFKGAGDMKWFIFATMLSFAIRLVMTIGLAHVVGVDIIWWAFCIGWVVSLVVVFGRYIEGGWKKKKIL